MEGGETIMSKYDPYSFTNISKDDFEGSYDGEKYIIKGGETKYFPIFLVNGFSSQWLDWAVNSEEFGIKKTDGTFDKTKFNAEKRGELEKALKAEPEIKKEVFKCEVCGKEFNSRIALAGHMRSHQDKK